MATWELFTSEYGDKGQKGQKKTPFGAPLQVKFFWLPSPEISPPEKKGPDSFWVSLNGNGF